MTTEPIPPKESPPRPSLAEEQRRHATAMPPPRPPQHTPLPIFKN